MSAAVNNQKWGSVPEGRVVIIAEFGGEMRAVEGFGHVELNVEAERGGRRCWAHVELGTSFRMYVSDPPPAPDAPAELEQPLRRAEP